MLKVNLLPPHIHMRKKLRMAIIFAVIVLAAEVGGLLYMENGPRAEIDRLTADFEAKTLKLNAVQKIKSDTDKVVAEEASFKPKYDFMIGMGKYNSRTPGIYTNVQRYIYREVMLLDLTAQQNSLGFNAYVTDPAHVSRLMVGLSRNPDFTDALPQITGVPGFGQQEKQRREQDSGSVPETSIIGSPGAMGMSGASSMGGMAMGPGMGRSGMSGPPGLIGPPGMGGMGGMGGTTGPGLMPGGMIAPPGAGGMGGMMMGGGGGGNGSIEKLRIQNATLKPRGFTVQVSAQLKEPITRPEYGSSSQQAGRSGGGGGGGMGGLMPPGMGGMGGMGGAPLTPSSMPSGPPGMGGSPMSPSASGAGRR